MEKEQTNVFEKMAEFIARAEISHENSEKKIPDMTAFFNEKSRHVDQTLELISSDIKQFREMVTRAGATRLRKEAKDLALIAKEETQKIEEIHRQTKQTIANQCDQLNKSTMSTVKHVSQLMGHARQNHLQKLSEQESHALKKVCAQSLRKIKNITQALQWKNLLIIIIVTLVTAMILDLYINDTWPWQAHAQIIKEREAGKILLKSWPALSHQDQEIIVQYA